MTSKPRGDRMGPKCRQRAPQKPPERVQGPKLIPTLPTEVPNEVPSGSQSEPKNCILGGAGAQVRHKGAPGGLRAPPEVQDGAKMAPKSIKKGSKIEELNDKRCLPLQPRRNERSSLNAPRQGSALPARRVKPVLGPCFDAFRHKTS